MPDDRQERVLNEFWNALVRPGERPDAAAGELDPEAAEIIRRLRAMAQTPPPDLAREQVRRGIERHLDLNPNGKESTMHPSATVRLPGSRGTPSGPVALAPPRPRRPRTSAQWLSAPVALVLLLVLTMVFGYRSLHSDEPAVGPSLAGSPIAAAQSGVIIETVADVVVPAEFLPTGGRSSGFGHFTSAPGGRSETPDFSPQYGVTVTIILSGQGTMQSDAPMRVQHMDGTTEDVPAGADTSVKAGDIVLFLNGSKAQSGSNTGAVTMEELSFGIFSTDKPASLPATDPSVGVTGESFGKLTTGDWARANLPSGSLHVTIRQVTLDPGVALPPVTDHWPMLRHVVAGTLTWDVAPAGGSPTPGRSLRFNAGSNVPWTPAGHNMQVELHNADDIAVVYWELAIEPANT